MKWGERTFAAVILFGAVWTHEAYGSQAATLLVSLGIFIGLSALFEELRHEVDSLRRSLGEREPKQ